MRFSQKQIFILAGAGFFIILLFVVIGLNARQKNKSAESVTIKFWGVESRNVADKVIQSYRALRPNVEISYTEFDPAKYDNALVNALASGVGPDVLYLSNRDLWKQINKLYPILPAQMNLTKFRDLFPTVVEQDFVSASGSQIFALPLYLDTLAMLYNKDVFDQAAIVAPPKTWDEFLQIVPQLRALNASGQIVRAAAAIGGSEESVNSGVDLLTLLMLQNGTRMTTDNFSAAAFASFAGGGKSPGLSAFNFYLQFVNAGSPYYTWNDGQPNSVDNFANGKVAVIFNYKSAAERIRNKSPFLNFGAAEMPQPSGAGRSINYPRYSGLAVSKQSKFIGWAWDFAIFATTNADASKLYLDATGHPPALRSLIAQRLDDPDFGIFARAALTARSWHEVDDSAIRGILNDAIRNVLSGKADSERALRQAEDEVSQLMTRN